MLAGAAVGFFGALLTTGSIENSLGGGMAGFLVGGPVLFGLMHVTSELLCGGLTRLSRNARLSGLTRARIEQFEKSETFYYKTEQQEEARRAEIQQQEVKRQAEIRESRRKVEEARRREKQAQRQREEQAQRQKLTNYWAHLEPLRFERELGGLYKQLGYSVQLTPQSGDHGVDLVLRKNGKTTVVQCKRQKSPAGERIVCELLGSMVAVRADRAVLACTGGFTQPAKDFVRGQPIDLLDAEQIIKLTERIERQSQQDDPEATVSFNGIPVCPRRGCGSEMVLSDGKFGRFWGCPRYPACDGTRQAEKWTIIT